MRTPTLLLLLTVCGVAAPAAQAATVRAEQRCHQETEEAVVLGTGYMPRALVTLTLDGDPIGGIRASASGAFRAKFVTAPLPAGRREASFALTATDGVVTAVTRVAVAKVLADFAPRRGDPRTLRVRFSVSGFNVMRDRSSVYLHYVRPDGRLRRSVRLGQARGPCGAIAQTRRRLLFPFRAERGRWVLQFDTNARYRRADTRSRFVWVRRPVDIVGR